MTSIANDRTDKNNFFHGKVFFFLFQFLDTGPSYCTNSALFMFSVNFCIFLKLGLTITVQQYKREELRNCPKNPYLIQWPRMRLVIQYGLKRFFSISITEIKDIEVQIYPDLTKMSEFAGCGSPEMVRIWW